MALARKIFATGLAAIILVPTLPSPRASAFMSVVPAGEGGPNLVGLCASSPVTCAVVAGVMAGIIITRKIGQGRKAADEFVQEVQNPFSHILAIVVDAFDYGAKSGRMSRQDGMEAKALVELLWRTFNRQADEFASEGGAHATVIRQSHATLDPLVSRIMSGMDSQIAQLPQGSSAGCFSGGFNPWLEGLSQYILTWVDAVGNFDKNARLVDRFVQEIQNPFGTVLGRLTTDFDAAANAGSMHREDAMLAKGMLELIWRDFQREAGKFAAERGNTSRRQTIVRQANNTLDPLMTRIFIGMDRTIARLPAHPPQVSLTRPDRGAQLSRVVPLEAVLDCSTARKIEFFVDGASIGAHEREGLTRWGTEWDSSRASNGAHHISVKAWSGSGESEDIHEVSVENTVVANIVTVSPTPSPSPISTPTPATTPTPTPSPTPSPTPTPTPTPTPRVTPTPTPASNPAVLTALRIPSVPPVRPPASFDHDTKVWLEGWAKYIGGRGDTSTGERNAQPCGVHWGDEPDCRIQAGGHWYKYPIKDFYPFVENVYWQLAARGEIRGNDREHSDFNFSEGPTTYAYNSAVATLLHANGLPVAGAFAPVTSYLSAWPSRAPDFDPKASQADILHSQTFQQALERQFIHQFPQYNNLRGTPLSRWPVEALHAREHAIADLYSELTSRRLDERAYVAMVADDVRAGRLPAGFKSYLETAAATPHGECNPSGACSYKESFPPTSPEYLCMDVGNTGRFTLQPKDRQPACGASNVGQVAVFPRSCGWNPAVCTGSEGNWKYLHEVRDALAGSPDLLKRVSDALERQGFSLARFTAETKGNPGSIPLRVHVPRPANGATLTGPAEFEIEVLGGARLRRVQLLANGRLVGGLESPPLTSFTKEMDTRAVADGDYNVVVRATDLAGSSAEASLRVTIANGGRSGADDTALAAKLLELLGGTPGEPHATTARAGEACVADGACFSDTTPRLVCMRDGGQGWRWQLADVQPPCSPDPGSRCRIAEFAAACPEPWGPARCYPGADSRNSADNRVGHWRFLSEDPPSPDPCAGE